MVVKRTQGAVRQMDLLRCSFPSIVCPLCARSENKKNGTSGHRGDVRDWLVMEIAGVLNRHFRGLGSRAV